MMNLQLLWFVLVAFLFTVFFVLEGFDYGVGMLYLWFGRNDSERRLFLNTIGPFWLGNELWMVCGIGALFVAFPIWFSALFSSLYPILFLILLALIARGVAIEFRNHYGLRFWRRGWDGAIFVTSLLVSFCWGMVLANVVHGLPLDSHAQYVGRVLDAFNLYALLGGVTCVSFFALYGALFLLIRVDRRLTVQLACVVRRLWFPVIVIVLFLVLVSFLLVPATFNFSVHNILGSVGGVLTFVAIVVAGCYLWHRAFAHSFAYLSVAIMLTALSLGLSMHSHVLVSSLDPAWSMTLAQLASAPYTLLLISWFSIPLLLFLALCQIGSYWLFRRRLHAQMLLYY
jgi:cytochrome d ubiquinol oxidase subunit II